MEQIWIEKKGTVSESDVSRLIGENAEEGQLWVAYLTDSFAAGRVENETVDISFEKLLEFRLFDDERELLIRRSTIGKEFYFRIASESAIRHNYEAFSAEDKKRTPDLSLLSYETKQTLDINTERSSYAENGYAEIVSTRGGRFILPIGAKVVAIKTKVYLRYDDEGMATADDFRYCSFV